MHTAPGNLQQQVCSHRPHHLSQPRHRLGPRWGDRRKKQRIDRWIREAIHITKEQNKSMKRD